MKYILRKVITLIITLFIVSLLAFLAFQVIPGSPATKMLGTNATEEKVAALEAELGFDDAGQVPAWALEHVRTLVAQGVVGGYENQLWPTSQVKRGEVAKMLVSLM